MKKICFRFPVRSISRLAGNETNAARYCNAVNNPN